MRALPRERPEQLTAPPDGQTLEGVIGDLQSTWGVPAYPQEYRITLKVAEEKDQRPDSGNGEAGGRDKAPSRRGDDASRAKPSGEPGDQPRREKAPAAPGLGSSGSGREKTPRKRRRRRRRGGGAGGGPQSGPPREKA